MEITGAAKKVFISHSCERDHPLAYAVEGGLRSAGLAVAVDPFVGGDRTCDKAQAEIQRSTHFVLLATENSINDEHQRKGRQEVTATWQRARWVTLEYTCAEYRASRQALILICVKVGQASIPEMLQGFIHVPFEQGSPLPRLSEDLTACIASTTPVTRLPTDTGGAGRLVEAGRACERLHATGGGTPAGEQHLHRAVALYDQAIGSDFCNHHAWLNKGWCLWKLGWDALAWRYVNVAQLLRPDSDRVRHITRRMEGGHRSLRNYD